MNQAAGGNNLNLNTNINANAKHKNSSNKSDSTNNVGGNYNIEETFEENQLSRNISGVSSLSKELSISNKVYYIKKQPNKTISKVAAPTENF